MKVVLPKPALMLAFGGSDLRAWRESIKVKVDGAEYTRAYKRGNWDGYKRPGKLKTTKNGKMLICGRGLLPRFLDDNPGAEVEKEYDPTPTYHPSKWDGQLALDKLRDYQYQSLEDIFSVRWGRIALATNAGKGAIIGIAAAMAADVGYRSLILTDEISVFEALETEIEKWGHITPAKVEAGREQPPEHADVTLGMIPTLSNRVGRDEWADWLSTIDMALLDEADRATADSWKEVIYEMDNNRYRLGFSGSFDTHDKADELEQETLMGPILIEVKNQELVRRKISAKPRVELHEYEQEFPDPPHPKMWFDWSGPKRRRWAYRQGVIENDERNALVQELIEEDKQNAVIVSRVDHGEILSEKLDDARFLYGEDSKEKRLDVLEDYRDKDFRTLIATSILDRGTNLLGETEVLIFAAGEGSKTQTLQRIGRGLRRSEDKQKIILRDVLDTPNPYAGGKVDPTEYFVRASKKRAELYKSEGFEIEVVKNGGP